MLSMESVADAYKVILSIWVPAGNTIRRLSVEMFLTVEMVKC